MQQTVKDTGTKPYLRERILGGACLNEGCVRREGGVRRQSQFNSIQYPFSVHCQSRMSANIPHTHWF